MGDEGLAILREPEKNFGAEVRARREVMGWSQRQLAEALFEETGVKLDPSAITRIEAGRSITLRQAVALGYVLGSDSLDLMIDVPRRWTRAQHLESLRETEQALVRELMRQQADVSMTEKLLANARESISELERLVDEGHGDEMLNDG